MPSSQTSRPSGGGVSPSHIRSITLLRAPAQTLRIFGFVCVDALLSAIAYVAKHAVSFAVLGVVAAALVAFMRSPPESLLPIQALTAERPLLRLRSSGGLAISTETEHVRDVQHGSFAVYWVLLGVLSSIGLGSGLHTFVLFLGPHIARVAVAALTHGNTNFSARIDRYFSWPASWDMPAISTALNPVYAKDAFPQVTAESAAADPADVSVLAIAMSVAWPSFLWGLGTAIGELPPYFIARAAAKSGEALEELEEVDEIEHAAGGLKKQPFAARAKVAVYEAIQRYGFVAILLAASIPNPLFDLAGLTCGHFGIPFATFFGATFLGKAIIKVSIQVFFLIFSAKYGAALFEWALDALPAHSALHAQAQKVHAWWLAGRFDMCTKASSGCMSCCEHHFARRPEDVAACSTRCAIAGAPQGESWMQQLWGLFILAMVLYFVVSIINAAVQERLARDAAAAAEAAPKSGKSARSATPHHAHVHGAQLVSAMVNAPDLFDGADKLTEPVGLGVPEREFVPHTHILNKSEPHTAARNGGASSKPRGRAAPAAKASDRATPARRRPTSVSRTPASRSPSAGRSSSSRASSPARSRGGR